MTTRTAPLVPILGVVACVLAVFHIAISTLVDIEAGLWMLFPFVSTSGVPLSGSGSAHLPAIGLSVVFALLAIAGSIVVLCGRGWGRFLLLPGALYLVVDAVVGSLAWGMGEGIIASSCYALLWVGVAVTLFTPVANKSLAAGKPAPAPVTRQPQQFHPPQPQQYPPQQWGR